MWHPRLYPIQTQVFERHEISHLYPNSNPMDIPLIVGFIPDSNMVLPCFSNIFPRVFAFFRLHQERMNQLFEAAANSRLRAGGLVGQSPQLGGMKAAAALLGGPGTVVGKAKMVVEAEMESMDFMVPLISSWWKCTIQKKHVLNWMNWWKHWSNRLGDSSYPDVDEVSEAGKHTSNYCQPAREFAANIGHGLSLETIALMEVSHRLILDSTIRSIFCWWWRLRYPSIASNQFWGLHTVDGPAKSNKPPILDGFSPTKSWDVYHLSKSCTT